jgi:hypothetical protein
MAYSPHKLNYDKKEAKNTNPVGLEYHIRNQRLKSDFSQNIPAKQLNKEALPWGFYGYTYLQHDKIWLNKDLDYTPEFKKEVEIHESIHTNDEYETRVISRHMAEEEDKEETMKRIISQIFYYN